MSTRFITKTLIESVTQSHLWRTQRRSRMSSPRRFLPGRCRPRHLPARTLSPQNSHPCHWRKVSQNGPLHLPIGANKKARKHSLHLMRCATKNNTEKAREKGRAWQWRRTQEKICCRPLEPCCRSVITNAWCMARHCLKPDLAQKYDKHPKVTKSTKYIRLSWGKCVED